MERHYSSENREFIVNQQLLCQCDEPFARFRYFTEREGSNDGKEGYNQRI